MSIVKEVQKWRLTIMKPIRISEHCAKLKNHYPEPNLLKEILLKMNKTEMKWFVRLWLSEGIPKAFISMPVLYEFIRDKIAEKVKVDPKEVTIVGSARIGYSLAPKSYGREFGKHSDLDLAIISEELFNKLKEEYETWKKDYESGEIEPPREKDRRHWEINLNKDIPRQIRWGFIDSKFMYAYYENTRRLYEIIEYLKLRLKGTGFESQLKGTYIRVYKNWESFVNHKVYTLKCFRDELRELGKY